MSDFEALIATNVSVLCMSTVVDVKKNIPVRWFYITHVENQGGFKWLSPGSASFAET